MALELCPNNYCGNNKNQIDGDCHDLDYQAGNKIVLQLPPMPRCFCICSCLAVDTPVATPDGTVKVQDIVPDQTTVLAAGLSLEWQPTVVGQASFATPGVTEHTLFIEYMLEGMPRGIVVTRDQPLLLHGGKLTVADHLQLDDQLVAQNGDPVQVVDVKWGSYAGNFYEFATVLAPPGESYDGHLVVTNGIVSGDFAIQIFTEIDAGASPDDRPSVGSEEWIARNHARTPHLTVDGVQTAGVRQVNSATFKPAQPVIVPDYAASFLPASQARVLRKVAPKRKVSDTYYHQMLSYITDRFGCLYPDIEFLIDWYASDPNAHSWVDHGKGHVLVKGGLARLDALELEGLSLAVAHEVGHLVGKPDGSRSGVTCEGEADYFGAKIVLRKLWFGTYYLDGMELAEKQLDEMFSYLSRDDATPDGYPSIQCRKDTFVAAVGLAPKPECAACTTPA